MAFRAIGGVITGVGATESVAIGGRGNILLAFNGGTALIDLERSFDDGATWHIVSKDSVPNPATYENDVNGVIEEYETSVLYRFNCTSYTSGAINYRISR